jgi:hypothetical protein
MHIILAIGRLKLEDQEFKASLGCSETLFQKKEPIILSGFRPHPIPIYGVQTVIGTSQHANY